MDIQEAASYGWSKEARIFMFLRNLTPKKFRKHSFLDDRLSREILTKIYHMGDRERIRKENNLSISDTHGDIEIYHGHGEINLGYVALALTPTFKKSGGYKEFVLKMAEHFGAERESVWFSDESLLWDAVSGNLWNGAQNIGHEQIADLADYFHKEFVNKHNKGNRTRIAVAYEKLTPEEIQKMQYSPRKVIIFRIE